MTFSPMSLLLLVKWFDSSLRASFNYATGKKERKKKEKRKKETGKRGVWTKREEQTAGTHNKGIQNTVYRRRNVSPKPTWVFLAAQHGKRTPSTSRSLSHSQQRASNFCYPPSIWWYRLAFAKNWIIVLSSPTSQHLALYRSYISIAQKAAAAREFIVALYYYRLI